MDHIRTLLEQIRDGQARALETQEQHLDVARQQLARAQRQVEESLALQREAVAKQKTITRIALPLLLGCVALIVYLIVAYL